MSEKHLKMAASGAAELSGFKVNAHISYQDEGVLAMAYSVDGTSVNLGDFIEQFSEGVGRKVEKSALPEALANFTITGLQTIFDSKAKNFAFSVQADKEWQVMPGITLSNLRLTIEYADADFKRAEHIDKILAAQLRITGE